MNFTTETNNLLKVKIKGNLFGGAIGDTLGYPVEFKSDNEIRKNTGKKKLARKVSELTHCHQLSTYSSAICAEIILSGLLIDKINVEKFKMIIQSYSRSILRYDET